MLEKLRKELNNSIVGIHRQFEYFCSAVCLPLVKAQDGFHMLFEVRSQRLKHQPGEICFPGGKIEAGDFSNPQIAAVRETVEELGTYPEQLSILGPLDTMITPTGILIYPFVGLLNDYQADNFSPDEVEKIIRVPLDFFLKNQPIRTNLEVKLSPTKDFPINLIPESYMQKWENTSFLYPTYFYKLPDGSILWGITARILLDFIDVYKRILEE